MLCLPDGCMASIFATVHTESEVFFWGGLVGLRLLSDPQLSFSHFGIKSC